MSSRIVQTGKAFRKNVRDSLTGCEEDWREENSNHFNDSHRIGAVCYSSGQGYRNKHLP